MTQHSLGHVYQDEYDETERLLEALEANTTRPQGDTRINPDSPDGFGDGTPAGGDD